MGDAELALLLVICVFIVLVGFAAILTELRGRIERLEDKLK